MQEQNSSPQTDAKLVQEFSVDVARGFSSRPKYLPPKYFYDEQGSKLFEQICLQKEYYLTRVETEILKRHSSEITGVNSRRERTNVIELGSGMSIKTRILLRHLISGHSQQVCYFPIDISRTALLETTNVLSGDFPNLEVIEIIADYHSGLESACRFLSRQGKVPEQNSKIILFLGSSIGNLNPVESVAFLRLIRRNMDSQDSLVIGFDLEKDIRILERAYNDRAGITAKFNLNILDRINNELGGQFDLSFFAHRAFYKKAEHRIEMHLVSQTDQRIFVKGLGREFDFRKGETIHTENSYKYTFYRIERLASQCGLEVRKHFTDKNKWFDLCVLKTQ